MDSAQKMDDLQEAFENEGANEYRYFASFGTAYLRGFGLEAVAMIREPMLRFPDGSEQRFAGGTQEAVDKKMDAAIKSWKGDA